MKGSASIAGRRITSGAAILAAFAAAGCTIIPAAPHGAAYPGAQTPAAPPVAASPVAASSPAPVPEPAPRPEPAPAPADPQHYDGQPAPAYAALGQTVDAGGPRVTPLEVLEDSRCPTGTQCFWPGQVRLRIRVDLGSGSETYEITSGRPILVADGTLNLADVTPQRSGGVDGRIEPGRYRFGFRFMGGI